MDRHFRSAAVRVRARRLRRDVFIRDSRSERRARSSTSVYARRAGRADDLRRVSRTSSRTLTKTAVRTIFRDIHTCSRGSSAAVFSVVATHRLRDLDGMIIMIIIITCALLTGADKTSDRRDLSTSFEAVVLNGYVS